MVTTQPSSPLNPSLLATDRFSDSCCKPALDEGKEKCCFLLGILRAWLVCGPSFGLEVGRHRKMKTTLIKIAATAIICSISIFDFGVIFWRMKSGYSFTSSSTANWCRNHKKLRSWTHCDARSILTIIYHHRENYVALKTPTLIINPKLYKLFSIFQSIGAHFWDRVPFSEHFSEVYYLSKSNKKN